MPVASSSSHSSSCIYEPVWSILKAVYEVIRSLKFSDGSLEELASVFDIKLFPDPVGALQTTNL